MRNVCVHVGCESLECVLGSLVGILVLPNASVTGIGESIEWLMLGTLGHMRYGGVVWYQKAMISSSR